MLVLTAKRDDRIKIGDDIEILIIYTADSRVRIGIEAPHDKYRIERKPRKGAEGERPADRPGDPAPDRSSPDRPEKSASHNGSTEDHSPEPARPLRRLPHPDLPER